MLQRLIVHFRVLILITFTLALTPINAYTISPSQSSLNTPSSTAGSSREPRLTTSQQSNYATLQAAGNVTEDILLIQTSNPWSSTANTSVLDTLGYSYRLATWADISSGTVDMFSYPVVLIVNDQVQAFYDNYAARVADFDQYVSSGHTLVFFAASDGWARGTLTAPLPGGVQVVTPAYEPNNYVVDADHPIITGQLSDSNPLTDADLHGNYCSHGYFTSLPDNTTIILRESHN